MITALAWMTLRASVTLAAILTAILLPLAVLMARRSLALSGTMLALVAMTWRAEAWKTVFLQSEQRVSELQRQLPPPISSSTGSSSLGLLIPRAADRCELDFASTRLLGVAILFAEQQTETRFDYRAPLIVQSGNGDTPLALLNPCRPAYLATYHPSSYGSVLRRRPLVLNLSERVWNYHTESEATPVVGGWARIIMVFQTEGGLNEPVWPSARLGPHA
jgi:hypothetical protein